MGQQQLLLVILVTIIVGIATVVAINTFGSAADAAAVDAARQDLASIAASAQGFYMKPQMLGGGGRTFDTPNDISFNDITFGGTINSATEVENENAVYTISGVGSQEFVVTAEVNASEAVFIEARVCPDQMMMGQASAPGAASAPASPACPAP